MTAQLSGRETRTLITALELLSDDEEQVLMLNRQEDGSVILRTRQPYENAWSASGPRYEVKAEDARRLSQLLGSQDIYSSSYLDDIPAKKISRNKPPEVVEAELANKPAECTELDIERAKAENLKEQREIVQLELERDHAQDKHITADVPGCPACERKDLRPLNTYEGAAEDEARDRADPMRASDDEEIDPSAEVAS